MKAFGSLSSGPWGLVDQIGSSAAGKSRLQNGDGTIVSVQPDGSIQSRPAGTDGPYEQAVVDAGIITYAGTGKAWPFGLRNV